MLAEIDSKDSQNRPSLHNMIENKKIEVFKILLNRKVNLDVKDNSRSALNVSAEQICSRIVEHLLKHGAHVNSTFNFNPNYTPDQYFTPLHLAAQNGSEETMLLLLSSGADVDVSVLNGLTPLHIAVEEGYSEIVQRLVKHGASVNVGYTLFLEGNSRWYTPLHFAARKGNEDITKLLLKSKAEIDAKGMCGITPLHIAAASGHLQIAEDFLQLGASVNSLTWKEGYTPLHYAAKNGSEEMINLLLNNDANADFKGQNRRTPLHVALEEGHLQVAELLLKHGACINSEYTAPWSTEYTPLHFAAEKGDEELVKLLLKHNANIDEKTRGSVTPLYAASKKGHLRIVSLLLDHGANVDDKDRDGKSILHLLSKGHTMIKEYSTTVNQILKNCSNVNTNGNTLIYLATEKANLQLIELLSTKGVKNTFDLLCNVIMMECSEMFQMLLHYDIDITASDSDGRTALHFITKIYTGGRIEPSGIDFNIREEFATLLLSRGANVNAKTADGTTVLLDATEKGFTKIVELVLNHSADVNCVIKNGVTPLHIASEKGYLETVKILLEFGAEVNFRDEDGKTALHNASVKGYTEVVHALLDHGSDINILNNENIVPFYCARSFNSISKIFKMHIVKMLSANLFVSDKNLGMFGSLRKTKYQIQCEEEIQRMKDEKIIMNNVVSIYDILTKSIDLLTIYARNENIVEVLKTEKYKQEFPIYASMINSNFRKGLERKELQEQAYTFFHFILNGFPLPFYNCIEKIFDYLRNNDLRTFLAACKPINNSCPNIDVMTSVNISS